MVKQYAHTFSIRYSLLKKAFTFFSTTPCFLYIDIAGLRPSCPYVQLETYFAFSAQGLYSIWKRIILCALLLNTPSQKVRLVLCGVFLAPSDKHPYFFLMPFCFLLSVFLYAPSPTVHGLGD